MDRLLQQIMEAVDHLQKGKATVVIAIDGSCAAGKSTLAGRLEQMLECNVFHMDDFFLRPEQRTVQRLAEPGGNIDYERFREEVLLPLAAGKPFSYRPYDCSAGTLIAPVSVIPKPVNIIEGSYSHHPYFGDAWDLRIFLEVTPECRERRIGLRPAFLHRWFFEEWIPMEQQYFTAFQIARKADLVAIPEDNK